MSNLDTSHNDSNTLHNTNISGAKHLVYTSLEKISAILWWSTDPLTRSWWEDIDTEIHKIHEVEQYLSCETRKNISILHIQDLSHTLANIPIWIGLSIPDAKGLQFLEQKYRIRLYNIVNGYTRGSLHDVGRGTWIENIKKISGKGIHIVIQNMADFPIEIAGNAAYYIGNIILWELRRNYDKYWENGKLTISKEMWEDKESYMQILWENDRKTVLGDEVHSGKVGMSLMADYAKLIWWSVLIEKNGTTYSVKVRIPFTHISI